MIMQITDLCYNKHLHNFANFNTKSSLIFAWQLKSVQIHFLTGLDSFVNTNCVISSQKAQKGIIGHLSSHAFQLKSLS